MRRLAILLVGICIAAAPAAAQAPVAMVESTAGNPGVEFMDYLSAGKILKLKVNDAIVIGYLKSCWREQITGGTVTIGTEQSQVQDGKVERAKVSCEAGKMQLATELASKSGGMVFRDKPRTGEAAPPPKPQFTLFSLSPVIEIKNGSTLVIERIDRPGERYEISADKEKLLRGTFYDFASGKQALVAGGLYRASVGTAQVVFQIAPDAKPGDGPLAGRLLRLMPAS